MTERENYLKTMQGLQPDWVPNFHDALDFFPPAITVAYMATEEKIDYCSVPWVVNDAGAIADTRKKPVMDDIADWKKYVHLPDLEKFDWENVTKGELANHTPDKALGLIIGLGGGGFFIPLMNMMGFENGLCTLLEDPDTVNEMFSCFCDFYERLIPYCIKYYHPDMIVMGDDLCTERGSFISMDTYQELLRPYYKRLIDTIHSYGVFFEFHMCGKCEPFIRDLVSLGINSWQPAQGLNDLVGLKKEFGNKLIFDGTWSTNGPAGMPGASEETVRNEVRNCMDKLAVGGGMIFWNGDPVGSSKDQLKKMQWLDDEARTYGRNFYHKQ